MANARTEWQRFGIAACWPVALLRNVLRPAAGSGEALTWLNRADFLEALF